MHFLLVSSKIILHEYRERQWLKVVRKLLAMLFHPRDHDNTLPVIF